MTTATKRHTEPTLMEQRAETAPEANLSIVDNTLVHHEPNPMSILNTAVANGADVNTLERISTLAKEWKADAARQAFNEAMARAQQRMPVVVMDRMNSHTKSRYAALETVERAIKPIYLEEGFTVSISEDGPPQDGMIHVLAVVRHTGGHVEQFSRFGPADTAGAKGVANKTAIQGAQSTVSYLHRRLLCAIFGVTVAGEDRDGNSDPKQMQGIDDDQMREINRLVKESGSPMQRFLKWAQVDSVSEITQADYPKCVAKLKEKIEENQEIARSKGNAK